MLNSVDPAGGYSVREHGIYFFTTPDKQGHSCICLNEFATGKTKEILTLEGPISFCIDVSPDGRTILYSQTDQSDSDLMLVENFR